MRFINLVACEILPCHLFHELRWGLIVQCRYSISDLPRQIKYRTVAYKPKPRPDEYETSLKQISKSAAEETPCLTSSQYSSYMEPKSNGTFSRKRGKGEETVRPNNSRSRSVGNGDDTRGAGKAPDEVLLRLVSFFVKTNCLFSQHILRLHRNESRIMQKNIWMSRRGSLFQARRLHRRRLPCLRFSTT